MAYACASSFQLSDSEVLLTIQPGLFGAHLGIGFNFEDGKPCLLHLAFHKLLVPRGAFPPSPGEWMGVAVPMGRFYGPQVVGLLREMSRRFASGLQAAPTFGFNVVLGSGDLNSDGIYAPGPNSTGYTCATFVANVFASIDLPLLDPDTWPRRAESAVWGDAVICAIRVFGQQSGLDVDSHVAALSNDVSGVRVLPEEVCAAGETFDPDRPRSFEEVTALATTIRRAMGTVCAKPPPPPAYAHCLAEYERALAAIAARAGGA